MASFTRAGVLAVRVSRKSLSCLEEASDVELTGFSITFVGSSAGEGDVGAGRFEPLSFFGPTADDEELAVFLARSSAFLRVPISRLATSSFSLALSRGERVERGERLLSSK